MLHICVKHNNSIRYLVAEIAQLEREQTAERTVQALTSSARTGNG